MNAIPVNVISDAWMRARGHESTAYLEILLDVYRRVRDRDNVLIDDQIRASAKVAWLEVELERRNPIETVIL